MTYVLFSSFILVFLATAFVTVGGLIGKFLVKDEYLKILVGALLVEVVAAMVLQFKALDISGTPKELEDKLMSLQRFTSDSGEKMAATERLQTLVEMYENKDEAINKLPVLQSELDAVKAQLEHSGALTRIFHNPQAVDNIRTAIDDLYSNEDSRASLDAALAKYHYFDVTHQRFVWTYLRTVQPDCEVAQALQILRKQKIGPFSPSGSAVFVSVPIPNTIERGAAVVRAGSEFTAGTIHISDPNSGNAVDVRATGLHNRFPIVDKVSGGSYELIQLNADTVSELFGASKFSGPIQLAQAIADGN